MNLGLTTLMLGNVERARSLGGDGLIAALQVGLLEGFMYGFLVVGASYAREDPACAARLLGRADLFSEETESEFGGLEGRVRAETEVELRAKLGENGYATAYAEGRALTPEDAMELVLRSG